MADDNRSVRRRCNGCNKDDDDDDDDEDDEDEQDDDDDDDDDEDWDDGCGGREYADDVRSAAAAAMAFDPLDVRRLPDLLDPERLLAALDGCLRSGYVRGCVVETWDATLSDHLDAIAHLVLYQTVEHAVRHAVYDSLVGLSAALRPAPGPGPARADAEPVYGTLRSAARSLLAARVDACCRQSMCRAVGLAAAALRASTRPVFTVENFVVEINEAAHFAGLYCGGHARRVCAVLADIYGAVMAGDYHPGNVAAQMAVMEKCIGTAVRTLADARATGPQKAAARRTLLADLAGVCATVRAKDHGCLDPAAGPVATVARPSAAPVHLTMSPWRAPILMYHQRSPVSVDQLLKTAVRLVETLVSEMFKPCLRGGRRNGGRRRVRRQHQVKDDKRL